MSVPLAHVFYAAGTPITDVYFLTNAVASLIMTMDDTSTIEVATVGNEGMVGLPVFLGAVTIPLRCVVQVPGAGVRMAADAFTEVVTPEHSLHRLLQCYTQALMIQVAQSMACNQLHALDQRCCRWLLMTHDRVGSDTFPLTQESLGRMLGVRRPQVSMVASALQKAGLIRYRRGVITILDRAGLEAGSCACYRTITAEFDRLLG